MLEDAMLLKFLPGGDHLIVAIISTILTSSGFIVYLYFSGRKKLAGVRDTEQKTRHADDDHNRVGYEALMAKQEALYEADRKRMSDLLVAERERMDRIDLGAQTLASALKSSEERRTELLLALAKKDDEINVLKKQLEQTHV